MVESAAVAATRLALAAPAATGAYHDRTDEPECGVEEPGTPSKGALDERFRRALDSILDLVVIERAVRDAAGDIVDFEIEWMNNAPVDVAGRPREELIGRRISELYPVLAGGELIAGYRRVVETGEPMVVEVLPYEDVIDGNPVSGYYTVQASRFEDGVLVASRDISSLERSRRELETALQELEAAQRLAQLGVWRLDLKTGGLVLSDQMQRMYGLTNDDATGFGLSTLAPGIHPEDRRVVRAAFERALATQTAVVVDHRIVYQDGSTGYVRSYTQPVVEGSEVVEMWGTTQDVTERVLSRDALDLEHGRRVTAEVLAEFASTVSGARSPQDAADAVFSAMATTGEVALATFGLIEVEEPMLRQYFGGPGVPHSIEARYLRIPVSAETPITWAVQQCDTLLLADPATQRARYPALTPDFEAVGAQSLAVVPMRRAGGTVLGAMAIGWAQPRELGPELVAMLQEVAALTAQAIERVEVLNLERSVAITLQQGLLALDPHSTRAIVRTQYRATDAAMEIGGDWYDAVELDDGRLAIAVGDVVGRGLPAAATMGQLRAALGVTALQAADPSDAVAILDRYAGHVPGAVCATVAFAMLDPAAESMTYITAGHPPPLLVTPDGEVSYLTESVSWPLGIEFANHRVPAATTALPAGSLLLLYTDGLVERRGESLEVGLEHLRSVVSRCWSLPLRRLKQTIFAEMVDEEARDDIALVAVRTVGSTPSLFADAFLASPSELGHSRGRLSPRGSTSTGSVALSETTCSSGSGKRSPMPSITAAPTRVRSCASRWPSTAMHSSPA